MRRTSKQEWKICGLRSNKRQDTCNTLPNTVVSKGWGLVLVWVMVVGQMVGWVSVNYICRFEVIEYDA